MKKFNAFKEKFNTFKTVWSVPRYRALIKLGLYFLMFALIITLTHMYSTSPTQEPEKITKPSQTSLSDIIMNTKLDNININYNIITNDTNYIINGEIRDNILIGYIENNDLIKKIILKDETFYTINSNQEIIDEELNNNIINYFLLPQNIIDLVKDKKSYIEKNEKSSLYTYNIMYNNSQYDITLKTNLKKITSIIINNDNLEYNLNLTFDNR